MNKFVHKERLEMKDCSICNVVDSVSGRFNNEGVWIYDCEFCGTEYVVENDGEVSE